MISPLFRMSGDEARGLLFGLMESDKIQLRKYPDMPSMRELIRDKRVVYDAYDPQEHWKTYKELVEEVRQNGTAYGDCEELAVAVAAEDQVRHGVQSLPFAYSPRQGLFHVVTAVPSQSVSRSSRGSSPRTVVSGDKEPAKVPFGFESWPVAMGAHKIGGYVLQDPSRAAGMGSFGYAPDVGVTASRYGGSMYGAEGKKKSGLGSAIRSFREGLLGGDTSGKVLSELGSGVRQGSGLGEGWAGRLGEKVPEAIGVKGKKVQPKEESAVKSLRKGMDHEEKAEAPSRDEEDDDEDLEDDDEEFGLVPSWYSDTSGLIDAVHSRDVNQAYQRLSGIHRHFHGQSSQAGQSQSVASSGRFGLDDIVANEMFGANPYYLDDGSRSEFQAFGEDDDEDEDDEDVDLDLDLDEDEDDDDDDDDDDDVPSKKELRRANRQTDRGLRKVGKGLDRLGRKISRQSKDEESFAGLSNLRRTDLFGGDFKFSSSDEDLLLDED